ncbi:NADH-quinone oxidoreductase subunit NuoE [Gleimia hominis]|uniref:NADH-quinone oxidoreductase subunit NuoE n=1 Tax=Gleimia hominis TaxID=595468 RepID=A0ABU3I9Q7_9ACTO|nr:NADH-quinone oxidoreductase subunit NuoE [Gleimia hominis]MDT3767098.1 NADH-quinone oxidoreductase subunit NuoE [Gleimia hominis]
MFDAQTQARLEEEAAQILSRYPTGHERSALLPLLHLVQSVDGYVSADGITFCAEQLDITRAEVSAVATFYTQYKRHPNGDFNVGVCTNALCAVMGGDQIYEALEGHLGVGHDETTADGKITLERLECNAACDYAPVVMVNWEFFDNQTPESAIALVDDITAGKDVQPTRGPHKVRTFKEISHLLAGFEDGLVDEGPSAGEASLRGLNIAQQHEWAAPVQAAPDATGDDAPPHAGEHGSSADRPAVTPEDKGGNGQ